MNSAVLRSAELSMLSQWAIRLTRADPSSKRAADEEVPFEPEALADSTEKSASASGSSPQPDAMVVSAAQP